MILDNEINLAIEAAKTSGRLLASNKNELNSAISSSSKDIKLKADIDSEKLIKEIISSNSNFPILAEESGKSIEDLGESFWVVDPLDGTANYNRDIPICCVSIGFVHNMKPVAGIIYDLNNDDLYVGNTFTGIAKVNDADVSVSKVNQKKEGIILSGLPHGTNYSEDSLKEMINNMQSWKKIRMIGSAAMASCYVASGKAECYKENGTYFWDIVAGAAIVESAGGKAEIINVRENYQVDVIFSNAKIKD